MFQRKIYSKLLEWKQESNGKTALLVEGARRIGKSTVVEAFAKENSISYTSYENLLKNAEIQKLFETEIQNSVNSKNGFKMFERISKFVLLPKNFEVGVELSAKQEIMRYRLNDIYEKEIKSMFN